MQKLIVSKNEFGSITSSHRRIQEFQETVIRPSNSTLIPGGSVFVSIDSPNQNLNLQNNTINNIRFRYQIANSSSSMGFALGTAGMWSLLERMQIFVNNTLIIDCNNRQAKTRYHSYLTKYASSKQFSNKRIGTIMLQHHHNLAAV